jgi:FkbH-like protein
LALCSKNNESDVLEVLRSHPDMLLREKHFATWEINWDDKATNLRRIATTLNIGMDSLVFVDDSEFEIDLIRGLLPEVETIRLPPKEYSTYRKLLASCGFFDGLAFTAEDRNKTTMYVDERRRRELRSNGGSITDYLESLKMQVEIAGPSEIDVPRVAQLTQKTNQFNLTARRYSEADIRAFLKNPQDDVLILKLRDSISDMGLVGAAIVRDRGDVVEIDSFMLSCRVIGRGVEDALLSMIVERAFRSGARCVRGVYSPTSKNAMVESFYARHGFSVLEETERHITYERTYTAGGSIKSPAWLQVRTGEESFAHR